MIHIAQKGGRHEVICFTKSIECQLFLPSSDEKRWLIGELASRLRNPNLDVDFAAEMEAMAHDPYIQRESARFRRSLPSRTGMVWRGYDVERELKQRGTAMSNVTMTKDRAITLPLDVCEKHGFYPETPIRIIETGSGVLLIPLTKAPMSDELAHELAEWQAISTSGWEQYPYEDDRS